MQLLVTLGQLRAFFIAEPVSRGELEALMKKQEFGVGLLLGERRRRFDCSRARLD